MPRLVLALLLAGWTTTAQAQSLVDLYRSARFRVQVGEILQQTGYRAAIRPVEHVPIVTDSLRRLLERFQPMPTPVEAEPIEPRIRIRTWSLTPKLAASWFEGTFAETRWSYLGSNQPNAFDTTYTRELRARLEAQFGAPTRTLAEQDEKRGAVYEEYIQFQYWFVVNDTLPLIVMDVNGPFERGVVVATDREYRDLLPDLKAALMVPLFAADRAPYVDYYYLKEQGMWFLSGYDGERYFLDRIARPNLERGRPFMQTSGDR